MSMVRQSERSSDAPRGEAVTAWSPTPAIWVSIMIHLTGATAVAVAPESWSWAAAAILANHIVLGVAGMWPQSRLLGENLVRAPAATVRRGEVALTFDDGPDPVITPRILDLLDHHGAKASFFCIGRKAASHASIVREIVRRGHSVENHTQRHSYAFAFYGLQALHREVEAGQRTIADITGRSPQFFRAPMGIRSPLLDPVMARAGLRYVNWARRGYDGMLRDPAAVVRRMSCGLKEATCSFCMTVARRGPPMARR